MGGWHGKIGMGAKSKERRLDQSHMEQELNGFISLGLFLGQRQRIPSRRLACNGLGEHSTSYATDRQLSQRALLSFQ